jgi:hypothetical protein
MRKIHISTAVLGVWFFGIMPAQVWAQADCKSAVAQDPVNVATASTASAPWIRPEGDRIGLYSCSITSANGIKCYLTWTRTRAGSDVYRLDTALFNCALRDNLKIEHKATRIYELNGRCQPQNSMTLAQGEAMWFAIEFAGETDGVNKALISCIPTDMPYGQGMYLRLNGKVE